MRGAIGSSFVVNFIITFIVIFILIFVGTLTYTKAYKVKNKIVDTIEYYDGDITNSNALSGTVQGEIDRKLGEIGYRVDSSNGCKTDGRFANGTLIRKSSNNYRYCIYKHTTRRGDYYGVVAYAYLEIPIIGVKLQFPVYGETKVFMDI
jgi:hypothetical protein